MRRAALVLAAVLVLAGCDNATSGTVTNKWIDPAHTDVWFQCMAYDGKGNCTMNMPMFDQVPTRYVVEFHNVTDDEDGSALVTPEAYDTYQVGVQYP